MSTVKDQAVGAPRWLSSNAAVLWLGLGALVLPTLLANAQQSWSTEQGAQAPLVLAIGLWLLVRRWPQMRAAGVPGSAVLAGFVGLFSVVVYLLGRLSDQFEIESYGLYALMLTGVYALIGLRGVARGWFPLAYLAFSLPAPFTLTWLLTNHLRIMITEAAVASYQMFGFSVARDGLNILIDQYELAVRDACSGMNSLVSLTAIGLVYIYLRRGSTWWYLLGMLIPIIALAVFGNYVRVLILIALTHYFGDAIAQSYLHEGAGFVTFIVAFLGVIGADAIAARLVSRVRKRTLS